MSQSTTPPEIIDMQEARSRAGRLAEALEALRAGQIRLLGLAERRERAVRAADPVALAAVLQDETDEIRQIAALDADRAEHAGWLAERLGAAGRERPRVSWITARLPASLGAEKQRLERAGASLREAIEQVARRTASDRLSAQRLAQHMRGLIETAAERLGASGGYSSRGTRRVAPAAPVGIDVTS